MPCKLLVKNIANSYSTGDVICVMSGDHVFGKFESKSNFISSGNNPADWPRQFVIVNITDADKSKLEYLLEDNTGGRRYFLTPQLSGSPYYDELLEHAEITTTKETLLSLVNDRGE